jgi:hypothetical protein
VKKALNIKKIIKIEGLGLGWFLVISAGKIWSHWFVLSSTKYWVEIKKH